MDIYFIVIGFNPDPCIYTFKLSDLAGFRAKKIDETEEAFFAVSEQLPDLLEALLQDPINPQQIPLNRDSTHLKGFIKRVTMEEYLQYENVKISPNNEPLY